MLFFLNLLILVHILVFNGVECLYPRASSSREVKKLDGIWNFKICSQGDQNIGFREKWYNKSLLETGDVIPMAVPSSFNDITQNKTIQQYIGWSWYQTEFYVPKAWKKNITVILRFGSVHYIAKVYVNGNYVFGHTSGHLPFEGDITKYLNFDKANRLTVAVNNTLSLQTIPMGTKTFQRNSKIPGYYTQHVYFDFFNYAGIHRPVVLYALPKPHIEDITIFTTSIEGTTGRVNYSVKAHSVAFPACYIVVFDKKGTIAALSSFCRGQLEIQNATLWWPYTMNEVAGYQYTMKVEVRFSGYDTVKDVYYEKFGIRTFQLKKDGLFINGKQLYIHGFGKHEDYDVRGRGFHSPMIVKEFNLLKWIGSNSFRTSHYPYSEELMDQADEQGVVVIEECPAVALQSFTRPVLALHMQLIREMIARDKNRPSVFAWSVANEPLSMKKSADNYFKKIVNFVKRLDPRRPTTAAICCMPHKRDNAGKHTDFVMINHYNAWYNDPGHPEVIYSLMTKDIEDAHKVYKKPLMMSEYGADTVAGLHRSPPYVFTEDYQTDVMKNYFRAFDTLRAKKYFFGEHIWNFADFMTNPSLTKVVGNKKGIFTREREPKASAKLLRCRYHSLWRKDTEISGYCDAPLISTEKCTA